MKLVIKLALIQVFFLSTVNTFSQFFTHQPAPVDQIVRTVQVAPITSTLPTNLPTSSVFAPGSTSAGVFRMADVTPFTPRPVSVAVAPAIMPVPMPVPMVPQPMMGMPPAPMQDMRQSMGRPRREPLSDQSVTLIRPNPVPRNQPAEQAAQAPATAQKTVTKTTVTTTQALPASTTPPVAQISSPSTVSIQKSSQTSDQQSEFTKLHPEV